MWDPLIIRSKCTPALASEAQIGLALRVLCGFSIDEIAEAFLSTKDTINKRLFREEEKLRRELCLETLPLGIMITEDVRTNLSLNSKPY